jgi:GGDEF domain-containing protein
LVTAAGILRVRHELVAVAAGLSVIGLGFVIDLATGRDLSLSLVYVAGVGLMVWAGSARVGVLGAVGASVAVLVDGVRNSVGTGTALTNAVTAFVLLLATVAVVDYMHSRMVREADRARFDALTGLPNRRACEERCAIEIARLQRRAGSLSVAFVDFDGLKQINDARGHAAGDVALVHFAQSAQAVLRPTDLLSRVGGDEFVLLLVAWPKPTGTSRHRSRPGSSPGTARRRASRNCSSKPTPSCTAPSAPAATATSSPKSSAEGNPGAAYVRRSSWFRG